MRVAAAPFGCTQAAIVGIVTAARTVERPLVGRVFAELAAGTDSLRRAGMITAMPSEPAEPGDALAWGITVPRT